MSKKKVCDSCGEDIDPFAGRITAHLKRKWRFRAIKHFYNGDTKDVRYDFCHDCWKNVLYGAMDAASEG